MTRFLSTVFYPLAVLLFIASIALSHTASAAPTQAPPAEQTDTTQVTNHGPSASSANGPTYHTVSVHHPRGDLGGNYSMNTPARPGFWIATGITSLVGVAFLITLVLFRPVKP